MTSVSVHYFCFPQAGHIPLEKLPHSAGPLCFRKVWLGIAPGETVGGRGLPSEGRTRAPFQANTCLVVCSWASVRLLDSENTMSLQDGGQASWSTLPAKVSPQDEADILCNLYDPFNVLISTRSLPSLGVLTFHSTSFSSHLTAQ